MIVCPSPEGCLQSRMKAGIAISPRRTCEIRGDGARCRACHARHRSAHRGTSAAPPPQEGSRLSIWYDPRSPQTARLARGAGRQGALVLMALAAGALFAPAILRRSLKGSAGGG